MKRLKKFSFLLAAVLVIISLASCKTKETRNTDIPLGTLADTLNDTIATAKDDTILTKGQFYTRLRANGYNTVSTAVQQVLFKNEIDYVTSQINLTDNSVNDYEQELFDAFAADIYQTSSGKTLKDLKPKEISTRVQKYIDTCSNRNIVINPSQISYTIDGDDIQFSSTSIPEEIKKEKILNIAINKATKDELTKIVDLDKVENEEGKMVTNNNQITEKNVQSYYEANQMNYGTYRAIIIQFNTLSEAQRAVQYAESVHGAITDNNALDFYTTLYNFYYRYRTPLVMGSPFDSEDTNFVINEDEDELSEASSAAKSILTTTFEEDGSYLKFPFNQNNKYLMVYRGRTTYEINSTYQFDPQNKAVEWDQLKEKTQAYDLVYAEIKDKLIDNKISTYASTVTNRRLKAADIEIYDPFFEYRFKNNYEDYYEWIKPEDFDRNNIFKVVYDNKTTTYSVEDFYNEMTKKVGLVTIIEQLKLEYIYQYKDRYLDQDTLSDLESSLDDELESFKKNENKSYPSILGEQTYLLANYGYTSKEDAIKYNKIASSVLNSYLNESVFDEWAKVNSDGTYPDDHAVDTDKLNILNNLLETGNANYKNLFSIKIDHLLIFIDDDGDGQPDDPKKFLEESGVNVADFNTELLKLSQAIYRESKCEKLTKSNDLMEILNYIVRAYNRNDSLFSDPNDNWGNYKKYNLQLKVESLSSSGNTTQSNVGNYVEEFADYVEKLYHTVQNDKLDTDDGDEPTFYFNYTETNTDKKEPTHIDEICATQFGYHLIIVDDYEETASTEKTESSDPNNYQKNIEILLNEKDSDRTDDNIYVIIKDTYNSDKDKANMNQFFTYYVQSQKGITSSLDSSIRDLLNSMFNDSISRYTSKEFQDYLLFNELNISIDNDLFKASLANYKGYLKRLSQDYDVEDEFENWYSDTMNWSRPY